MQRQRGVALVVVLALLVGAVMIGVSTMQSSLVDERLAGNYRMAAQAQMNAEKAASAAVASNDFFDAETWQGSPHVGWFNGLSEKGEWEARLRQESHETLVKLAGKDESGPAAGRYQACEGGNTAIEKRNACFYFPITIVDDADVSRPGNYVVAVGWIKDDAGGPQSRHVMLVQRGEGDPQDLPGDTGVGIASWR